MSRFSQRSLWGGWIVFAIATLTYLLTMEPTASLWDCSEFIATSYKLEVGHPPGTPFFFLINRLGAIFAGDPSNVAVAINALSAIESGLTIAFLFWTIAHLGRRLYGSDEERMTGPRSWAVLGAAAIGSLAYTWTDTFWFSAVEAEVYALSSLFTAVVFWAILKWENVADRPGSNRWLVLIAYLMGLSVGAHILNLLAIPAIVFIYYFKKFPGRPKADLWKPGLGSIVLTGLFYKLTPALVAVGAFVDRIFVNGLGFSVNSGLTCFVVVLLAALGWGVWRTQQRGQAGWNAILLSVAMAIVGISTYGIVLIRAGINPPMNSNNPSNPYTLLSFLNRDQYGAPPLLYGESYASPAVGMEYSDSYFVDETGKYRPVSTVKGYEFDGNTKMLFPRMYSAHANHVQEYKRWAEIKGRRVRTEDGQTVTVPTFGENLRFFFAYQLNHMYWRYFLWNFVGRQSDIQSNSIIDGNWLSGIRPIDELYLGPQDGLPSEVATNRGRNTYYFLPFILGLIGFFYQLKRDGRNFLVVFLLFFMTGVAIILYLNQTPLQPRERDYAYAGSFYAFAIWIGLGVQWVYDLLHRKVFRHDGRWAASAAFVLCASVPAVLAVENWDDHDRSRRYVARDMGYNYLIGVLPNGIIIDYGDNDTFPLWYNQEVEGVRPDVRVMNSSYISGDWYIDQMRMRANESAAVPHSMPRHKYYGDAVGQFPIRDIPKPDGSVWTIGEVMEVVNSDDPRTQLVDQSRNRFDMIPARRIAVPVNKENVIRSGIVRPEEAHLIEDTIYLDIDPKKQALLAGEMVFLDMLASGDWTRPIHFTSSAELSKWGLLHFDRGDGEAWSYLQQDGITYRLVPIKSPIDRSLLGIGRIDTETLYDNLMNKYRYGNLRDRRVYADYFVSTSFLTSRLRMSFARLANALTEQGDTVRAVEVLDRAMEELPLEQLRVDDMVAFLIEAYYRAGAADKGDALALRAGGLLEEYLDYYARFTGGKKKLVEDELMDRWKMLYNIYVVAGQNGRWEVAARYAPYFEGV
ncbi:MAG: DUF2723 domain-containing protein [Rikenella sp.]|nr:DUF2723 domain-containing protein [Rikenella sp.]